MRFWRFCTLICVAQCWEIMKTGHGSTYPLSQSGCVVYAKIKALLNPRLKKSKNRSTSLLPIDILDIGLHLCDCSQMILHSRCMHSRVPYPVLLYHTHLHGQIRIQYGGSVTPENCKELIAKPNIDGFLVGTRIGPLRGKRWMDNLR